MWVRKTGRIGSCKNTLSLLELGLAHCRALRFSIIIYNHTYIYNPYLFLNFRKVSIVNRGFTVFIYCNLNGLKTQYVFYKYYNKNSEIKYNLQ